MHSGLKEEENLLSFEIRLDAIMTECFISLESSYVDVETVQFQEGFDLKPKTFQSRKGGSIPQDSARRLKELLALAAVSVLQHIWDN